MDAKQILWTNVRALMSYHWGRESLNRLAREACIGPGTATRIKDQRTSVGVDTLDKVAKAFDLHAWQLLMPNLDPSNPPVATLTEAEKRLYQAFSIAMQEYREYKS